MKIQLALLATAAILIAARTSAAQSCDQNSVATAYAPAQDTFGQVMFEDRWPLNADLDFNDQIIGYNFIFNENQQGAVSGMQVSLVLLAAGATLENALYLHLPVPAGAASSILLNGADGVQRTLTPLPGETELVLQISPDTRTAFNTQTQFIDTAPAAPVVPSVPLNLVIQFAAPLTLDPGDAPYDLFIERVAEAGHQIHRPMYAGTTTMNNLLFRTGDDGSTITEHFINTSGLPFALTVPALTDWPIEGTRIDAAYPNITGFAKSGGAADTDWYTSFRYDLLTWQRLAGVHTSAAVIGPALESACGAIQPQTSLYLTSSDASPDFCTAGVTTGQLEGSVAASRAFNPATNRDELAVSVQITGGAPNVTYRVDQSCAQANVASITTNSSGDGTVSFTLPTNTDTGLAFNAVFDAIGPGSGFLASGLFQFPGSVYVPDPIHEWTFNPGTIYDQYGNPNPNGPYADGSFVVDIIGGVPGFLHGDFSLQDGQLILGAKSGGGWMASSSLPETVSARTMVSWVSLSTLNQAGGSGMTLENSNPGDNYFDAIDFGEVAYREWTAGSDFFIRTQSGTAPVETVTGTLIEMAYVYDANGGITIYRDGQLYQPAYNPGPVRTYNGGATDVYVGQRHSTCGSNCYLYGAVDEVRLYAVALTQTQIQSLTPIAGGGNGSAPASGPYPLPSGAVSWFKAESDFSDALGNNFAEYWNASYDTGEVGQGFYFPGNDESDFAGFSSNAFPSGADDRTVEGWLRVDQIEAHSYQCVFGYGSSEYGGSNFGVAIQNGQLLLDYQFAAVVGPNVTDGQILHFAAVASQGNLILYVNGVNVGEQDGAGFYTPPGTMFTIGSGPDAAPFWGDTELAGVVDELTVYNRALAPSEIAGIYNAGSYGKSGP